MDQETLNKTLAAHHIWLESAGQDGQRADLSGADLRFLDLSGARLKEAVLHGADLVGTNLTDADLEAADLEGATLLGARLEGANLERVHAPGVNFFSANMTAASLRGADLREALLQEATLTQAKLHDATLTEANLLKAMLREADLTAADLRRTELTHAYLGYAGMERAQVQEATLRHASLEAADLRDARFDGANLEGACVREAHAPGVIFAAANLHEVDFTQANLRGARLDKANLEGALFLDADLAGITRQGATLGPEFDQVLAEHHAWMRAQGGERAERVTAQLAEVELSELRHAVRRASDMTDAYTSTHSDLETLPADASPDAIAHAQNSARGSLKEGDDREAYEYAYHGYRSDGGVPSGTAWEDLRPAYFDAFIRNHGLIEPEPTRWERIKQRVGAWFSREDTPAPNLDWAPAAAPSPESHADRDPAVGQHRAPAKRTPTREDAQAACAQILAQPEETRAAIAQMADPAERAKAAQLLAIVEQDAAARQRTPERAAAAERDR